MPKYQVMPPQQKTPVKGFIVKDEDYRPAYETIHFYIVDAVTGEHTGDHFETEPEAVARAAELNNLAH
ncbi:hypothetical protein [Pseudomonas viridiflava]|uniref:hypothetical protein n=1 Tax=Pseudomonas viridiflava TaxID=33069 RepID=UPI000F05AE54|nr:hypothetical protein [Pseudomonas viridiflava]